MDAAALYNWVREIHSCVEDFDEGDLGDRLYAYDRYELECIDLAAVDADEWALCEEQAQEYADMPGAFPPIVFDAPNQSIIDGTHRVNAALLRGDTAIWAYCPVLQD